MQKIATGRQQQGGDGNIKSFTSRREASTTMPSKFRAPSFDVPADGVTTGGSNGM
jgi:hypothetical protein